MAHFLRDEQLTNITVTADTLREISQALATQATSMPEYTGAVDEHGSPVDVFLVFTVRFDQKGYRLFDIDQLIYHFNHAAKIERVIFELISNESLKTNKLIGSLAELRLDVDENHPYFLTVTSDSEQWVQATFSAVREIINKHRNRSGIVHNWWTVLLIQLMGVAIGFFISVWAASKIAPNLAIENAFLISFVMALLVYSNLWVHLNQMLIKLVFRAFPNIRFHRPDKDKRHWLYQSLIGGLVVAAALFLLNLAFSYVGHVLGGFIER